MPRAKKKKKTKYIFAFDLESNGLPESLGDAPLRPVELACLLVDLKTKEVVDTFNHFVRLEDDDVLEEEAVKTHGRTRAWLKKNGHSRTEVFAALWFWLEDHGIHIPMNEEEAKEHRAQIIPLGQNVDRFDIPLLRGWAEDEGYPFFCEMFSFHSLDTLPIAKTINEAAITAFGYGAQPFADPETGFPSARLIHQALGCGFTQAEIDEGAHGALWDIHTTLTCYLHHINRIAKGLLLMDEREGILVPEETSCPYCGAFAEQTAPHTYKCFICNKTHKIEEV